MRAKIQCSFQSAGSSDYWHRKRKPIQHSSEQNRLRRHFRTWSLFWHWIHQLWTAESWCRACSKCWDGASSAAIYPKSCRRIKDRKRTPANQRRCIPLPERCNISIRLYLCRSSIRFAWATYSSRPCTRRQYFEGRRTLHSRTRQRERFFFSSAFQGIT